MTPMDRQSRRLRDVVTLEKGKPPAKKPYFGAGADYYLTPDYLRGRVPVDLVKPSANAVRVSDGDTIVLWDGSNAGEVMLGRAGILASTMTRASHGDEFNKGYFFYALKLWESFLKGQTSGSGIPHVDKEILGNLDIIQFDLLEQTKISEILSTVDQAIEQTEKFIAKQQRIKSGLMQDLLTRGIDEDGNLRSEQTHKFKDSSLGRIPIEWKVGYFEYYVVRDAGIKPGPFGSSLTKNSYSEYGYRVYGQEQVIGGSLNIGDYYIPERKFSQLSSFSVKQDDVLISLVGSIGHVLIVPPDHSPGVINPRLLRFRPDPLRCRPVFLKVLLQSQPVRLQLNVFATGGTMPVLSGGIIRKLRIVIVEVPEQDRISQALESSERVLLSNSQDLAKLRRIKTGLMQALLTGKCRVTALLVNSEVVPS